MIEFLQVVLNGLVIGSEYVLVAIGFTLIFGVMGVMNVAQADFYALGAFVMIWVSVNAGLGIVVGAIIGMLSGLVFGLLYYFLVLRRLGEKDFFAVFIASVGVSYFIENLLTSIVGSQGQSVPPLVPYVFHKWGGLLISDPQLVLLAATVVITVGLLIVLGKTPFGRDIRAVSESRFLAAASGVNCRAVMIGSVLVASVIATIGGVLVAVYDPHRHSLQRRRRSAGDVRRRHSRGDGKCWRSRPGGLRSRDHRVDDRRLHRIELGAGRRPTRVGRRSHSSPPRTVRQAGEDRMTALAQSVPGATPSGDVTRGVTG